MVTLPLVLASGLSAACGEDEPGHDEFVELRSGSFRGVKLGDSEQRLRQVLGPPTDKLRGEAAIKAMPPVSLPFGLPDRDQTSSVSTDTDWVYPGVTIRTAFDKVYAFYITGRDIAARDGAGIGQDLDVAREHQPTLDCEPSVHPEFGSVQKCDGKIAARRYVWFGGDPIDVIILEDRAIG